MNDFATFDMLPSYHTTYHNLVFIYTISVTSPDNPYHYISYVPISGNYYTVLNCYRHLYCRPRMAI